ncbi:asparagine synthase (glutamine-hydrolyzing) [Nocardioides okcheonensis]|uniref:asparagine synthase (glutamine-hydrolyzing) n=1 Tax=Nocardioides okcheonensis TaxID=2894081 RepID=UPI001E367012|nr:asparagine synthase (glutamine-hydrolyzing) [Nocardioides okcheonensis]UFN46291.1 asparagine synthase (glutamine-hydrolyzing) [Nocardioides okcheonensis]
MSGLAGVRTFSGAAPAAETLSIMSRTLQHRGPDESSVWVGPDVGLAHARLAVLDTEHSHQPMHSPDGRWVVALDGAITNHASLRTQLDHPFRTRGDTEVVVAGLALEGISFVERLHGQFAIAAHDLRTGVTHLVRDRLGVLPLYYRHVPGGIAFASEVKALLAIGPAVEVDLRSLDAYLGSRTVPAPDTLFQGVKKVLPGHRAAITPRGHLEQTCWWTPPESDPEGIWTAGDAIEAVGDGVREAVRAALVSDVPVGVHLGGGVGSALVAAEVQQLRRDAPLPSFAVGLDVHPPDRLAWTRRTAELMGTEHHEVRLRAADFEDLWHRLTWHREAPISDPCDVAQFGLAQDAGRSVRVVLSGEGGDELFGGLPHRRLSRLAAHASLLPGKVRASVERHLGAPFAAVERQRLLGSAPPAERRAVPTPGADPYDRQVRDDVRHLLPDHLLERGDRLWTSGSLAWRPPLLDHRLVELAFRLPTSVRVRSGSTRWLLEEAARPLVPEEVIDRPRTDAPRVPLDTWFRNGLHDTAREWLGSPGSWVAHTLDPAAVRALVESPARGAQEDLQLWTLLSLEMWHHAFFGAAPVVPRPRATVVDTAPSGRP